MNIVILSQLLGLKCVFKQQDFEMFGFKFDIYVDIGNFHSLEVVGYSSKETLSECKFKLFNLEL